MEGYTLYSLRNQSVLNPYYVADLVEDKFTYNYDTEQPKIKETSLYDM